MIDPIGVKPGIVPGTSVKSFESTPAVVPIESARPPAQPSTAETSLRETAKAMAAQAPIDAERVREVKRAIEQGRFPILPAKIADRLIAAQFRWAAKK